MRCLSFYCLIAKKSINQEKEQRRRNLESLIDKLDENSVLKWLVLLEFGISPNQQLLFQEAIPLKRHLLLVGDPSLLLVSTRYCHRGELASPYLRFFKRAS